MQKILDAGGTPLNAQEGAQRGTNLSVERLAEQYGPENAREVYFRAALAAGHGDIRNSASGNLNPLDTTDLSDGQRDALEKVLADADAEFGKQKTAEAKE